MRKSLSSYDSRAPLSGLLAQLTLCQQQCCNLARFSIAKQPVLHHAACCVAGQSSAHSMYATRTQSIDCRAIVEVAARLPQAGGLNLTATAALLVLGCSTAPPAAAERRVCCRALVEVAVQLPQAGGLALAAQLYSSYLDLPQRLLILDCLGQAARQLAHSPLGLKRCCLCPLERPFAAARRLLTAARLLHAASC